MLAFELRDGASDPARQWLGARLGVNGERPLTIVRFEHSGWMPGDRWMAFCNSAWGVTLSVDLKHHCESLSAANNL